MKQKFKSYNIDILYISSHFLKNISAPKTIEVMEKYHCPNVSIENPATSSLKCKRDFLLMSRSQPFNFSSGDTYVTI